jgi:hypothetical protein
VPFVIIDVSFVIFGVPFVIFGVTFILVWINREGEWGSERDGLFALI